MLGLVACVSPNSETPVFKPTLAPPAAEATVLSNQDGAVQDIRGCLAIKEVLNVFYLIDDSGSLADTDPERLRVDVLADSLASLANLSPAVQVNWASGAFKSDFTLLTGWAPLGSAQDAEVLRNAIPEDSPGWTNWEAAVVGARDSLVTQSVTAPGCSLLIWLTDGVINLGAGGDGAIETENAFNRLCVGAPGVAGIMQRLRTDQVVVFGVLLNVPSSGENRGPQASERLIRLVEAAPDAVDSVALAPCGVASSVDVRGTVEVVKAAGDLAKVFDRLPALLAGGTIGDIDPDSGDFLVPAGVSRFAVQFGLRAEPWVLEAPNGQTISQGDLDSPAGVRVSTTGSAAKPSVDVVIESADMTGTWRIVDHLAGQDLLYRFSDLQVDLDDLQGANYGVVSGEGSIVTGVIRDRDGAPANLNLYRFEWRIQELLPGEPLPRDLPSDTTNGEEAQFAVDLSSTIAQPGDQMSVVINLTNLRTVDGDIPLAGPTVSLPLTVLRPGQVPRDVHIEFSGPAGSPASPAEGNLVAELAEEGNTVGIQVPENALGATVDRFDREFQILGSGPECIPGVVVCGEFSSTQALVPFTLGIAPAEKPRYSVVTGEVLVELLVPADADSPEAPPVRVIQTLPFTLDTERPINLGLLSSLLIGLLLLGLAIPIVLAWALKRFLVWITHDRLLQRAEFAVTITDGLASLTEGDLSDETALVGAFRNLPPHDRVRSHADTRLGILAIRVPWKPLAAAWFALTPPAETRLIAAHTGEAPRRLSSAVNAGRLVATNGVLASLWAVALHKRDLLLHTSGAPLAGTLVVYLRPVQGAQGQYAQRLREIFATTDWRARVGVLVTSVNVENDASHADAATQESPSHAAPNSLSEPLVAGSTERRPPGRPPHAEGSTSQSSTQSPNSAGPPRSRPDGPSAPSARPPGR
jgi:hypothetical protein